MQITSMHIVREVLSKLDDEHITIATPAQLAEGVKGINHLLFFKNYEGKLFMSGLACSASQSAFLGHNVANYQHPVYELPLDYNVGVNRFGMVAASTAAVLMNNGDIITWGSRTHGQMGDGVVSTTPVNRAFTLEGKWDDICYPLSMGHLPNVGTWYCKKKDTDEWYHVGNDVGGRSTGISEKSTGISEYPTLVRNPDDKPIKKLFLLAGGDTQNLFALTKDNYLYAIGGNISGACGVGTALAVSDWTLVQGLPNNPLTDIEADTLEIHGSTGCIETTHIQSNAVSFAVIDGEVYSAGSSTGNMTGIGGTLVFAKVPLPSKVFKFIACNQVHGSTLALLDTQELWGWGPNLSGELASATAGLAPTLISSDVEDFWYTSNCASYGYRTPLYIKRNGIVYVTGYLNGGIGYSIDPSSLFGKVTEFKETMLAEKFPNMKNLVTSVTNADTLNFTLYIFTEDGKIYGLGSSDGLATPHSPITLGLLDASIYEPVTLYDSNVV